MKATKFEINFENKSYFKYQLGNEKGTVGLKFLKANSYTVNVTTYSSYEAQENKIEYSLAYNQFKEIEVGNYIDYIYIVIEVTKDNYTYDDYLTIYDSGKPIKLEHNQVISINNFMSSNQQYRFTYKFEKSKTIAFYYNTKNYDDNNYRNLEIEYEGEKINYEKVESLNKNFNKKESDDFTAVIYNKYTKTDENEKQSQGFTLMIREIEDEKHFNKIEKNKPETINYIYNKDSQIFYFYANITGMKELNTINFKFDYRYYKTNITNIKAKYVPLDEDIKQEELQNYIPDKNDLISSYDVYSDEYYRIYLNNNNQTSKYLYIFATVEIKDESYYYGSKSLEYSMGEEEEIVDYINLTNIAYNNATKIEKQTEYYIPYYWKLKLDKNDVYLLGISNEHMFVTTFVRGDLISVNNTINLDALESNNEVIVLSNMTEFTIRLFGIKKNVQIYFERVRKNEIEYVQEYRERNKIFTLNMKAGETKYILGTYSFDDYSYGKLTENYYPTNDSGEFDVFFSEEVDGVENHLFPPNTTNYTKKFDEIIPLKTHLDLFTIKCKKDGIMYIRPQYKQFDYTIRNVTDNKTTTITMSELLEIAQLWTDLGKREETLYFTVNLINPRNNNDDEKSLTISPDTKGAFEKGTIKGNQIFTGSYDLSKYRLDELALLLNSTVYGTQLEIFRITRNKNTTYKKLNNETNTNLKSYKNFLVIPNDTYALTIRIGNLNGTNISFGIIKSPLNDINYNLIADEYKNQTIEKIDDNIKEFTIINSYLFNNDTANPYIILFLSVIETDKNLDYNLNISLHQLIPPSEDPSPSTNPDQKSNNTTKIVIIVVIVVVVVLIVVGIILFNVISKKRKERTSTQIEKLSSIDSTENQLV